MQSFRLMYSVTLSIAEKAKASICLVKVPPGIRSDLFGGEGDLCHFLFSVSTSFPLPVFLFALVKPKGRDREREKTGTLWDYLFINEGSIHSLLLNATCSTRT